MKNIILQLDSDYSLQYTAIKNSKHLDKNLEIEANFINIKKILDFWLLQL